MPLVPIVCLISGDADQNSSKLVLPTLVRVLGSQATTVNCYQISAIIGRVFRNNYKGHMDKTKGEVEGREVGWAGVVGEWWEVNAENCNGTTIK